MSVNRASASSGPTGVAALIVLRRMSFSERAEVVKTLGFSTFSTERVLRQITSQPDLIRPTTLSKLAKALHRHELESVPSTEERTCCKWCEEAGCAYNTTAGLVRCSVCHGRGTVHTRDAGHQVSCSCPNCSGRGIHLCRCIGCHPFDEEVYGASTRALRKEVD